MENDEFYLSRLGEYKIAFSLLLEELLALNDRTKLERIYSQMSSFSKTCNFRVSLIVFLKSGPKLSV